MRQIRLALYFVVGLLLGAVSALSFAETVPATESTVPVTLGPPWIDAGDGINAPTAAAACALKSPQYTGARQVNTSLESGNYASFICTASWGDGNWIYATRSCPGGVPLGTNPNYCVTRTCPGSDWVLEGTTCTRNKCAATSGKTVEGWAEKGSGYGGSKCIDGCTWNQSFLLDLSNPQDERVAKDGKIWGPVTQTGTGATCTASAETPNAPEPRPKDTPKKPPCGAGEGVIGTSTGKVLCLPEANPDVRKPDVKRDVKLETFPDGSKKQTETLTTRDPITNNKDVASTVTTTAGTSGGTMAGTPGVTTSSEQSTGQNGGIGGEGSGDGQCSKEPNSPLCKAGTVKPKGNYGEGQNAEIESAKAELRAKFAEVKNAASSMFSGSLSAGAGSLPCYAPIAVLGQQLSMCFTKYESSLSVVSAFVMLMAALGAAFIILRR